MPTARIWLRRAALVATATVVPCVCASQRVHIAFGPQQGSLRVSWTTANSSAPPAKPTIFWGSSAGDAAQNASAFATVTYGIADMSAAPANEPEHFEDPGFINHATIVSAFDQLWYACSDDGNAASPDIVWRGPVSYLPSPQSERLATFFAFGDQGVESSSKPGAANVTEIIRRNSASASAVVHVGDISYAAGTGSVWREWFEQAEPAASVVPYHVCGGNHDMLCDQQSFHPPWPLYFDCGGDGGECGVIYDAHFAMPAVPGANKPNDINNEYHSFDIPGALHFAFISSERDMRPGTEQYEWLRADLAAVDRQATPFVVFGQHRPFYASDIVRAAPEQAMMREILEPLLLEFEVNAALFGHVHQYERTCALANHRCRDDAVSVDGSDGDGDGSESYQAPVYLTIGMAGPTNSAPFVPALFARFQSYEHGLMKFDVVNATAMRGRFLASNSTNLSDPRVIDEFWIRR